MRKLLNMLFILILVATFLLVGCTPTEETVPETAPQKCFVQSCHFESYDLSCAPERAGPCTLDLRPTDFCGQFVSCDDSCNVAKEPLYDACVVCFKGCNDGECDVTDECLDKFPSFKNQFPFFS